MAKRKTGEKGQMDTRDEAPGSTDSAAPALLSDLGEAETVRRRDDALRRALAMPPKPHKQKSSDDGDK